MNVAFARNIQSVCSVQLIRTCRVIADTGIIVKAQSRLKLQGYLCACRVDPCVCDKSRIARSSAIATPNLAAGYQGILGKRIKSSTSARHNLYDKKRSIQENLNTWQLCAKKISLSAHSVLAPRLLLFHSTFSRISFDSGTDSHMLVKPSGLAGEEELDQGWLHSSGFFSSAPFQSFPRKSVHAGPGSML